MHVTVHFTKREVAFLHQDQLIEALRGAAEEALLAPNAQRTFMQGRLPRARPPLPPPLELRSSAQKAKVPSQQQPSYCRPDRLVRTDAACVVRGGWRRRR